MLPPGLPEVSGTRALLHRPDFFKVAVSTAGDHDDLVYQPTWGEKFFGQPDEIDYHARSNAALADRLPELRPAGRPTLRPGTTIRGLATLPVTA